MTFNFVDEGPTKATLAYASVNSSTPDWWVVNSSIAGNTLAGQQVTGTDSNFTGYNDSVAFDFGSGHQGINAAVRGGKLFNESHVQVGSATNLMTVFKISDGTLRGTLGDSRIATSGWNSVHRNRALPKTWEFTQASDITAGGGSQSTAVGEDPETDNLADFFANWRSGSGSRSYFFSSQSPICFARGTLIQTNNGEKKIEDLRVGDLIYTRDNGVKPIR